MSARDITGDIRRLLEFRGLDCLPGFDVRTGRQGVLWQTVIVGVPADRAREALASYIQGRPGVSVFTRAVDGLLAVDQMTTGGGAQAESGSRVVNDSVFRDDLIATITGHVIAGEQREPDFDVEDLADVLLEKVVRRLSAIVVQADGNDPVAQLVKAEIRQMRWGR